MVLLETVPVIAPVPLQSMMPPPPEESLLPRLVELVTVFPSMVNVEPAFTYKFIFQEHSPGGDISRANLGVRQASKYNPVVPIVDKFYTPVGLPGAPIGLLLQPIEPESVRPQEFLFLALGQVRSAA